MAKKRSKKIKKFSIGVISVIIITVLLYCGYNSELIFATFGKISGIDVNAISNVLNTSNVNKENVSKNEFIAQEDLKVYYIDVGQADSILIINKNQSMLIDAGNNEDGNDVVKFIKDKGISKLNYVIGTHPHEDHIGGLDDVINQIDIENVLMPRMQTNTKTFEDVLDAISNKGLNVIAPQKGYKFSVGDSNCEVMTDSIEDKNNINLSSIVIRLTFGNNSFLFMGDAEKTNEKQREWPKTDVLKVGHHGSDTSSGENFLKQVNPKYAIIMVGKANTYNLPKKKTITNLERLGAKIYRTDENGTIEVMSNGNEIDIVSVKYL